MRVLVVTNMYPTKANPGSGTFVAAQVESLRSVGVEIELLFLDRLRRGREVYRGLAKKVRVLTDASAPDLVHVMYGGVMASAVTRTIRERPVLLSFCGDDLLGGESDGLLDSLALRYGVRASRRAAARAAGIVVKSQNLFNALPRGVDNTRVWIVPNGVDLSRFRPRDRSECLRALGLDPGRRHVLFPADPTRPEKRFALAQASVALLNHAGRDVELHALENVPHEDVPLWLNAARVVLVTSSHEGSPNAVKEALACEVPIVSVDVGDVRERIEGIEGCFIADPTADDIAAKLSDALERDEPIRARDKLAELSLDNVAVRLRDIYQALIDRTDRPPAASRGDNRP
jgi:glycosyltransferase involved in cell wall biosynthesis